VGSNFKKSGSTGVLEGNLKTTADNQITIAELMKGHYFTAATLSRTNHWLAADGVSNYYIVFNF
jgi:hypothetical protein